MPTDVQNPELVASLTQTACEVLDTMAAMQPTASEAVTATEAEQSIEFVGVLDFTGPHSGSFVVRTTEAVAKQVAAGMLMMAPEELTDLAEVADAFGEIVNMISGGFKNDWVSHGKQMNLSTPQVVNADAAPTLATAQSDQDAHVRLMLNDSAFDVSVYFER